MSIKTFDDLFELELRDMLSAEQQLTKALPKMAKKASNAELAEGFQTHLTQTEGQIERLKQVMEMCGFTTRAHTCEAMKGLLKEGDEAMSDIPEGPLLDAMLIADAQKVEHYEIATYGTLIAWAKQLGHDDAIDLLAQNLDEERETDELLTGMAENTVNDEAIAFAAE